MPARIEPGRPIVWGEPTAAQKWRAFKTMPWALPELARRAFAAERPVPSNPSALEPLPPLYREILRRFRKSARAMGARPMLMILPRSDEWFAPPYLLAQIREFCRAEDLPLLDLFPVFERFPRGFFSGHPNAAAHQAIADALGADLRRRGWGPGH